jgi:hypothetical protein
MLIQGTDKISKNGQGARIDTVPAKMFSTGTVTRLCEEILSAQKSSSTVKMITFSVTLSKVFQYHILVQL